MFRFGGTLGFWAAGFRSRNLDDLRLAKNNVFETRGVLMNRWSNVHGSGPPWLGFRFPVMGVGWPAGPESLREASSIEKNKNHRQTYRERGRDKED